MNSKALETRLNDMHSLLEGIYTAVDVIESRVRSLETALKKKRQPEPTFNKPILERCLNPYCRRHLCADDTRAIASSRIWTIECECGAFYRVNFNDIGGS